MPRIRSLSAIQPTGHAHLGNYLGAIARWVVEQEDFDTFFFVVDLHAMTSSTSSQSLASDTRSIVQVLLAAGIDPTRTTVFAQSQVSGHTDLAWLLSCTAKFGELNRMTQFRDKASRGEDGGSTLGLFSYPVLMAADILLYDAERIPVGDDQRQHVELCREIVRRFNHDFGDTFRVPEAVIPSVAARVGDLVDPGVKMSKSRGSVAGTIFLLDPPDEIRRKIRRATTDSRDDVVFDPETRPGVSNLLTILSACSDIGSTEQCADTVTSYGALKSATTEAVIELLRPLQDRYKDYEANPDVVTDVLRQGRERAQPIATATLERVRNARGLMART